MIFLSFFLIFILCISLLIICSMYRYLRDGNVLEKQSIIGLLMVLIIPILCVSSAVCNYIYIDGFLQRNGDQYTVVNAYRQEYVTRPYTPREFRYRLTLSSNITNNTIKLESHKKYNVGDVVFLYMSDDGARFNFGIKRENENENLVR